MGQRKKRPPGAKRENPLKTAKRLEEAAKRKKAAWAAIELKSQGLSLEAIAQQIGYANKSSVSRLIEQEMAATPVENVETLRRVEDRHLDWMRRKLIGIAKDDDESAHDRINAIRALTTVAARRAKILGLDAPLKTELTGKNGGPLEIHDIASKQDGIRKRLDQLRDELVDATAAESAAVDGERPSSAGPGGAVAGGATGGAAAEGTGEAASADRPDPD